VTSPLQRLGSIEGRRDSSGRSNGRLYNDFLKSTGVFNCVVTNAPFMGRVEKGDDT
jgi:hypothetical protein